MSVNLTVRKAAFAGPYAFYTNDRKKLAIEIKNYLNSAKYVQLSAEPMALIAPHAGYVYSGQAAAWAYKQIINRRYERIIIFAPSHRSCFSGVSVFPGKFYETPLGEIPLDTDFCKELSKYTDFVGFDSYAEGNEHSLEVQLPFLQMVQKDFKIVPILVSDQSYANCLRLSDIITELMSKFSGKTLMIASSDLFHGQGSNNCNAADELLIETLLKYNPKLFNEKSVSGEISSCGYGPITTCMLVSKNHKRENIEVLYHTNSVDSAGGSEDYVVGYLAGCIY